MKQKTFVLERDINGTIILATEIYGVYDLSNRFETPNHDGLLWDDFIKSIREGDRIEIKVLRRKSKNGQKSNR